MQQQEQQQQLQQLQLQQQQQKSARSPSPAGGDAMSSSGGSSRTTHDRLLERAAGRRGKNRADGSPSGAHRRPERTIPRRPTARASCRPERQEQGATRAQYGPLGSAAAGHHEERWMRERSANSVMLPVLRTGRSLTQWSALLSECYPTGRKWPKVCKCVLCGAVTVTRRTHAARACSASGPGRRYDPARAGRGA